MDIKTPLELTKIIAICRKNGINYFKDTVSGVEFGLGSRPIAQRIRRKVIPTTPNTIHTLDNLTPEDVLNWSSRAADALGGDGEIES